MADQTFRFPEGIAKDIMVKIRDHYVPFDFMVLDMGEEDDDTPIILGRPFLNTTSAIIYMRSGRSTSNSLEKRYAVISIVIQLMNSQRRTALGGGVDPNAKRFNPSRMDGRIMKQKL
jgi:hypothetical protein